MRRVPTVAAFDKAENMRAMKSMKIGSIGHTILGIGFKVIKAGVEIEERQPDGSISFDCELRVAKLKYPFFLQMT